VGGQGAGEGDALGLAAGEAAGFGSGVVGEAHVVQPLGGLGAGLGLGGAVAAGTEGHVVERGEVREEQIVLEDHADRAGLRGRTVQLGAVEPEMAAGERGESGECAQGGGLAGAVGAEQCDDVTGRGGQRHVEAEGTALDHEPGVKPLTARARGASRVALPCVVFSVSLMRRSSPALVPNSHPQRSSCGHPAVTQPGQDRDGDGQQDQAEGDGGVRVVLEGEVDGERHGLGAAGEVAGEGDRRPELAQRAGPASTAPAAMPGAMRGSVTRRKAVKREAPRVVAASS
jgi:hypothetical protein